MQERLIKSGLTEFPWGGKTKSRQELKGKTLLYLLFKNPSYYLWVLQTIENDKKYHDLFRAMDFLLEAIETVRPIAKCRGGNTVLKCSVNEVIGDYRTCGNDECLCMKKFHSSNIAPYTFKWMFMDDAIQVTRNKSRCMREYKSDFGLPARYSEEKYLSWLSDNVNFERMKTFA